MMLKGPSNDGDKELQQFNFSNNNTKLTYAKGKFILALAAGAIY